MLGACGRLDFVARDAADTELARDVGAPAIDTTAPMAGFVAAGAVVSWSTGMVQTLAVSRPSNVQIGDVLLLHVAHHQVAALATPAGWTVALANSSDMYCGISGTQIWWHTVAANEPGDYSVTCTDYCAGAISQFRGLDPNVPIDAIGQLGNIPENATENTLPCGTNLSPQDQIVPSVTTTGPDEYIALLYSDNNDTNASSGQAMPIGFAPMYNMIAAENILGGTRGPVAPGASGTTTVTVVNENIYGWEGVQIALHPAP